MPVIPSALLEKVNIVRHTSATASLPIYTDTSMSIQPERGGLTFQGMRITAQSVFNGYVEIPLEDIEQGDAVQRSVGKNLYIWRIDRWTPDHQKLILGETPTPA